MTQQQIEQAALEYAANVSGLDYIGEVECEKAFMTGANYVIQQLYNTPLDKVAFELVEFVKSQEK